MPKYLSLFLNSILGRIQFDRQKTGSSQFNINIQQIRDLWIIEPEKNLQEEIGIEVFGLIEKVSALKNQYSEKLKQADDLFIKMIERPR
jgi:restriction endonuclease S subunit